MREKGFTLIELMVVVALLSILAGILVSNMNITTRKTRDTKRKADLDAIVKSLLMYGSEHGAMPNCGFAQDCAGSFAAGSCLVTALAPYIDRLPTDPLGAPLCYSACTNGSACNDTFPGNPFYVQVTLESTMVPQYVLMSNP